MRSKYYGYVLRNQGTTKQQWVLSEIPVHPVTVLGTTSTAEISSGGVVGISYSLVNECSAGIGSTGTFSLPEGLYKISYSLIAETTDASEVIITLSYGGTVVNTTEAMTSTGGTGSTVSAALNGEVVIKSTGCGSSFSLQNASAVSITPVLAGTDTVRVIIEKLV